jgi:hypothetical protein
MFKDIGCEEKVKGINLQMGENSSGLFAGPAI